MRAERGLDRWYWVVLDAGLLYGLAGGPLGFAPVLLLGAVHALHYRLRNGGFGAFPVQVRVVYLALLVAGEVTDGSLIHWLLAAGTTLRVTTGYCLLARALSLMPRNRRGPLTLRAVLRQFASRPVPGSVLDASPGE